MSNYVSPEVLVMSMAASALICQSTEFSGNAGEFEEQTW